MGAEKPWPALSGSSPLLPIRVFHGIFKYSSNDIQIFEPKIFEYLYSVHFIITNILVFVFGPEIDPKYIGIHIHVKRTF